jgi:hypothetical protein
MLFRTASVIVREKSINYENCEKYNRYINVNTNSPSWLDLGYRTLVARSSWPLVVSRLQVDLHPRPKEPLVNIPRKVVCTHSI